MVVAVAVIGKKATAVDEKAAAVGEKVVGSRRGERERDMLVVRDMGIEGGGSPPMTAATAEETVDWIE